MDKAVLCASLLALASACGDTIKGNKPVLSDEPSPVEIERFARRLHLDLTGQVPADAYIEEAGAKLQEEGNTAAARGELADDLMATREFADNFVTELDNRAFAGDDVNDRYQLLCQLSRMNDPACQSCGTSASDPCSGCSCPRVAELAAERDQLAASADDFFAGATTSEIERRYASSAPFSAFQSPEQTAQVLFLTFLGRPAEADEEDNASRMVYGITLGPDNPAGLLFQQHGSDTDDLMDIVFGSEVYREAAVSAVFDRYLGRPANQAELAHFSAELDAEQPDLRPVIRAVVSSGEYFEQ